MGVASVAEHLGADFAGKIAFGRKVVNGCSYEERLNNEKGKGTGREIIGN